MRGLVAGVAGTAAMTAWQEVVARLQGPSRGKTDDRSASSEEERWRQASAPAQVARRILERLFHQRVSAARIGLLTNVMHWGYGTGCAAGYGLLRKRVRTRPALQGVAFGGGVWALSYAQLVPMGLYEPPWKYPPTTLAKDISYHLVYGVGVATAYEALGK